MPLISVIIPNYNHATYLRQRISSILDQTFDDFEVIILDDCSSDNSREVIETYRKEAKVSTVLYNEENSGSTFLQWEKGIALASGEWIWIAESDDWCEKVFLETLVKGVLYDKRSVLGYCQSYCIVGENEVKFQSFHNKLSELVDGEHFIRDYMTTKNSIFNASMAIWKKSVFGLLSKEYTGYKFCGDWLFWAELSSHGKVFISGQLLNFFRKHSGDVSTKFYKSGANFKEEIKVLNSFYQQGLTNFPNYLEGIQAKYMAFKGVAKNIGLKNANEIESLFFEDPNVRKKLQAHYFTTRKNNFIKRLLNKWTQ